MGLLDLIKKAGHGIVQGVDNAAYNSLGGGLLGSAIPQPVGGLLGPTPPQNYDESGIPIPPDPSTQPSMPSAPTQFKPNPAQTRNMRSDFLMSIGSALQQHRPLAEGIQDYQQRTVGQLQAGQAAQEAQAKKQALASFQQEMAAAAGNLQAQQQVLMKYSTILGPQETKAYADLSKTMQPDKQDNENMGPLQQGVDPATGKPAMFQGRKVGAPIMVPNVNVPPDSLAAVGDMAYDPKTGMSSLVPRMVDGEQKYVKQNLRTGEFFDSQGQLIDQRSHKIAPYEKDNSKPYGLTDAALELAGIDPSDPSTHTPKNLKKFLDTVKPPPAVAPTFTLSPEAKDMLAQQALAGGAVPSFGARGGQTVADVYNKAAEMKPGADLASAKTDLTANRGAIASLEKQQGAVNTFENTASKNLDLADTISKKVDRTGSPVLNRFLLHAKGQYAGDTDTQLLGNAVETAASEYAKVVSGGMNGGPVSDAARQHARDMLTSAMGQGTFSQAVALMKQEMGNRRTGYADQLQELRSNRPGAAPAIPNPGTTSVGTWKVIGVK